VERRVRILASAGPTDRILKGTDGKLRSFPEIMYEFYSWDARRFVADFLKGAIDNPPQSFHTLSSDLQEKARGLLIVELVSKFCESAEDLAAFGIAFATEFYKDALDPDDVWKKLAEYETGDVVNFYRDIQRRGPDYFANLHGYPPLNLQEESSRRILFRSCKQLAAYMSRIAEFYDDLRELHNAYKHGMRIFFGHLTDEMTKEVIPSVAYVDKDANTKAILFAREMIDEIFELCSGMGELLGAMLHWRKLRIEITKSGKRAIQSPVFGRSTDVNRQIGQLFFPGLFEIKEVLVSKAAAIAAKKSEELSKLPRGHVIAIDVDLEEILPFHGPDHRTIIWQAMKARPGARLVFRRITPDGRGGHY
jgi:hypothetical protein